MNTYNENLQATFNNTLAGLAAEKSRLQSEQIADDYTLYYAQEARIATQQALDDLREVQTVCQAINDQGQLNDNTINNLQQSATLANTDVAASNTNMATAASNVNIAANAIAALSADLGSALNTTIASLLNTDLHKQVKEVNDFINEVANDARDISRLAMDASSKTSEIVAQAVLQQTGDVKTRIDGLFKTTQAALDTVSSQVSGAQSAANLAAQQERQAEGAVLDIDSQVMANSEAYRRTNGQLNLGLDIQVNSSKEIGLLFTGLPAQLPQFRAKPASDIVIPSANPVYYLMLLPQSQMSTFSIEQAQQLIANKSDTQYRKVSSDGNQRSAVPLGLDAYGESVQPGVPYVAWLYIELSTDYHRFISDFSNLLSSPSLPFTPATLLPLAQASGEPSSDADSGRVTLHFQATGLKTEPKGLEYRCILVESGPVSDLTLLASAEYGKAPIYFNLEIAGQVAPANYSVAVAASGGKPSKKKAAEAGSAEEDAQKPSSAIVEQYTVTFDSTTTDNFGNLLKPQTPYQPYILALVNSEDNEHSAAYTSKLSDKLDVVILPAA
ncbi:hypothetical protein [Pseudomonas sp. MWU13-2105]|uniref:hypothetical protein n=1 Tax=Pseudomonas sp. MWU13-2105 TaxID=2935074 RepID=UPI00200DAC5D|nr:hypothetical protein [Pseudomonas sp. MWU13-2105]